MPNRRTPRRGILLLGLLLIGVAAYFIIAPGVLECMTHLIDFRPEFVPPERDPSVAEFDHVGNRLRSGAGSHDDGRMRLLDRLRPCPRRFQGHELAIERGHILGPQRLDHQHLLSGEWSALGEVGAVALHLLHVPSIADDELEPPSGEHVHGGSLFGGPDRIALGDEADPASESERGTHNSTCGESRELLVGAPVLLWQRARSRDTSGRCRSRGRDVAVFSEPQ